MGQVSHNLHDDNMFQEKGAGGGGVYVKTLYTHVGVEKLEREKREKYYRVNLYLLLDVCILGKLCSTLVINLRLVLFRFYSCSSFP